MTDILSRDEPAGLVTADLPDAAPRDDDPGQSWCCGPFGYWPA